MTNNNYLEKNKLTRIYSDNFSRALTNSTFLLIFLISGLLFLNPVFAHSGATGIVKKRMDMMDKIGKNMKNMKAMVQGKKTFIPEVMARHAESISSASTHIKNVFPEGSIKGKSEALPSIWQKWDKFESISKQLTVESKKLKEIALTQNRREIMKQFAKVGKTCRSCHTDFRKKKDEKK